MGHSKTRTNRAHKLKSKRSARIGVLILIGGMLALITEAQFEPRMVKVARVIDGDTIQVLSEGRQHTVRLIGVDTPETKHPTEVVQRFGQEASAFTTAAVEGRTVQLETDRTGDTVDRAEARPRINAPSTAGDRLRPKIRHRLKHPLKHDPTGDPATIVYTTFPLRRACSEAV